MWKPVGIMRGVTAAAAAVLVLAGCGEDDPGPVQANEDGLVSVTYIQVGASATTWPMYIGEAKGFFEDHGIEIDKVQTQQSPGVGQGLIAGSADIGSAGVPDLVRPIMQGGDLSVVAVGVARPPFAIVGTEDVSSWADLADESVTVDNAQGIGRFFFDVGAEANGLSTDDVEFVYVGSTPDRYAALESGSVAAAMLSPPFTERAVAAGYPVLTYVADYLPDAPFQALAVNNEWADANADTVVDFFRAYMESIAWLNDTANRQEAAEILAEGTGSSLEDSLDAYDFYVGEIQAYLEVPRAEPAVLDEFLGSMSAGGFFEGTAPAAETFVNSSYVDDATS